MLLEDRWNDIYVPSNDQYFCQDSCKFESYNITSEKAKCSCYLKEGKEEDKIDFSLKKFIGSFSSNLKNSNFLILKCYKILFNINKFRKNYGSMIMFIILICFFITMIIYFIKGQKKLQELIICLINIKKEELNENKNFPPKRWNRNSKNMK